MTTTSEKPTKTEASVSAPPPKSKAATRRTRKQVVMIAIVLALVSAASLILLLTMTGQDVSGEDADVTVLSQGDVTDALLRNAAGPGSMEVEALYTPSWYFQWSGRSEPVTDGSPTLAFFLFETTHIEDLPPYEPDMAIVTPSGSYEAAATEVVSDSPHHRVTQLMFPAEAAAGEPIIDDTSPLVFTAGWRDGSSVQLEWEQPMPFGLGALNTEDTGVTFTMPPLSFGAVVAIFSGMFAALTPCLLLLAAYYAAVLSSTAAAGSEDKAGSERRVLMAGLTFVGGFTVVYTAGGIIAGYVGESVSRFENIGSYSRPVSVVAGIIVILMGIRMASQSRVPLACKLPVFNRTAETGWVGSVVMGSTFAIGCLSCFSATVLTALLLYAGATGSPLTGGLVMLMFSAGTGVMFLLAAVMVARAAPLAEWLTKAQPIIGGVSAVIMIALGILMVIYKFHVLTGYLFEAWS